MLCGADIEVEVEELAVDVFDMSMSGMTEVDIKAAAIVGASLGISACGTLVVFISSLLLGVMPRVSKSETDDSCSGMVLASIASVPWATGGLKALGR